MRNIWRIIKADARSLFTHFFALAVALAIAVLPSLYAWLNIYSNWDPYGNTGNISIAVASLDKGWTEEDGTQVNKGREVVEDLRSSTSINWVIVDTKEEAERGVYAGDYYAAVVIDEDFSYNMYHMLTEWTDKPTITYYENYKKNAVATKITDTAVSSLKTTISKSYLDVVVDAIFRGANDLSQQLSQEDPVGSVQGLLGQTRSLLRSCAKTIDAFQAAGQDNSSYRQDLSDLVSNINQNRPDGQQILDTVAQLNRKVHAALEVGLRPIVCANLPYNITTPILELLWDGGLPIRQISVMVQKEAAQRICAEVGSRQSGAVTVAVNYYAKPQILFGVSAGSFMPAPKVDSAVIRLDILKEPCVQVEDEELFFKVVKAAFSQRRKTLPNSLSAGLQISKLTVTNALNRANVPVNYRAEQLTMEQLAKISNAIGSKQ